MGSKFSLKASRNCYYHTIRAANLNCSEDVYQAFNEIYDSATKEAVAEASVTPKCRQMNDIERCWTVLRYTNPCV